MGRVSFIGMEGGVEAATGLNFVFNPDDGRGIEKVSRPEKKFSCAAVRRKSLELDRTERHLAC
jgi:hypothetical protein